MGVYDPYERLYDLGLPIRHGRITPDLSQLLETGDPPYTTVVGDETPKAVGGSASDERRRAATRHTSTPISDRFRSHEKMDRQMVRPRDGSSRARSDDHRTRSDFHTLLSGPEGSDRREATDRLGDLAQYPAVDDPRLVG